MQSRVSKFINFEFVLINKETDLNPMIFEINKFELKKHVDNLLTYINNIPFFVK